MGNTNKFYIEFTTKSKGSNNILTPTIEDYETSSTEEDGLNYELSSKVETIRNPWDEAHDLLDELNKDGKQVSYIAPQFNHEIYKNQSKEITSKGRDEVPAKFLQNWVQPKEAKDSFVWHLGDEFSQLRSACLKVYDNPPKRKIRIAHIDTGIIGEHPILPINIAEGLARSFVVGDDYKSAEDKDARFLKSIGEVQGHGTGTICILAGRDVKKKHTNDEYEGCFGAIPYKEIAEIIPIRISETVALIRSRNFVRAIEYAIKINCDVITMSMAGSPSRKWAKVINKAYEKGIVIVTAAGNNWVKGGKILFPRTVLYPARWDRVIAATGVCYNHVPYNFVTQHDIIPKSAGGEFMQGNHGPNTAMKSALAAYTPNLAWAVMPEKEGGSYFDRTGGGTSSATPQIAAAAALWMAYHQDILEGDIFKKEPWRKVEAVKKALFDSAKSEERYKDYFGRGIIKANDALNKSPETNLEKSKKASVFLLGFSELFGLLLNIKSKGEEVPPYENSHHAMFLEEAIQLMHKESKLHKYLTKDWENIATISNLSNEEKNEIITLICKSSKASERLKIFLKTRTDIKEKDLIDLQKKGIEYITELFVTSEEGSDLKWISTWLSESLIKDLKSNPHKQKVQIGLTYKVEELLTKKSFRHKLEELIKAAETSKNSPLFENGYALLIGIGGVGMNPTVADAKAVEEVLIDTQRAAYPQKQVIVLTEEKADRKGILAAFDQLYEDTKDNPDATIIILYSGHGDILYDNQNNSQTYYIKPHDFNPNALKDTWVSGVEISDRINKLQAKKLLFLMDCCHAAGVTGKAGDEPSPSELIKTLNDGEGKVFIASCAKDERSYIIGDAKNSLFTECIIEVLNGVNSHDENESGYVLAADLMQHLLNAVPNRANRSSRQQHPVVSEVKNLSEFYICRYNKKIKILPKGGTEIQKMNAGNSEQMVKELLDKYEHIIKHELATPSSSSKDVIIALITEQKFIEAFTHLTKKFGKTNATYNNLIKRYTSRANNFNEVDFGNQLIMFVQFNYSD